MWRAGVTLSTGRILWKTHRLGAKVARRFRSGAPFQIRPSDGFGMERVTGIEPVYSAWKAAALPLCYTRALCGGPLPLPTARRQWSVGQCEEGNARSDDRAGDEDHQQRHEPLAVGAIHDRALVEIETPVGSFHHGSGRNGLI